MCQRWRGTRRLPAFAIVHVLVLGSALAKPTQATALAEPPSTSSDQETETAAEERYSIPPTDSDKADLPSGPFHSALENWFLRGTDAAEGVAVVEEPNGTLRVVRPGVAIDSFRVLAVKGDLLVLRPDSQVDRGEIRELWMLPGDRPVRSRLREIRARPEPGDNPHLQIRIGPDPMQKDDARLVKRPVGGGAP